MSETPPEFDLKFLPDWLKEGPATKDYSTYEGDTGSRRGDFSDRRGPGRPGGGNRDDRRGPRPGGPGARPGGPGARPGGPGGPRPGGSGPGGPRRAGGPGGDRRGGPPQRQQRYDDRPPQPVAPPVPKADVRIEFVPDPTGAANISKQIRQSGRAYPLFGTGRLFLERPERHRVRITTLDPAIPLFQIGDGPVSFDRTAVERNAFRFAREEYYKQEVQEGEPIKGNFGSVARSRTTGTIFGPTSHHSYQPSLRRLYDERFARRMSFQDFVQSDVEIVSDEQVVADWKERARSSTTYTTTKEAEPIVFKSMSDAEQHFRKHYLPTLVKSGTTLECTGQASRSLPDRHVSNAVRDVWEKERAFPAGLVNYLRPYLLDAGLHFFKHRKRILFISAIKPVRQASNQEISTSVDAIIKAIESSPKCTRRDLAKKILGENHDSPEVVEQKAALAKDLHYLIHSGHVLEFHDGTLDLPFVPGQQPQPAQKGAAAAKPPATAPADETAGAVQADEEAALAEAATEPAQATAAPALEAGSALSAEPAPAEAPAPAPVDDTVAHAESREIPVTEKVIEESPAPLEATASAAPEPLPVETESDAPAPAANESAQQSFSSESTQPVVPATGLDAPSAPEAFAPAGTFASMAEAAQMPVSSFDPSAAANPEGSDFSARTFERSAAPDHSAQETLHSAPSAESGSQTPAVTSSASAESEPIAPSHSFAQESSAAESAPDAPVQSLVSEIPAPVEPPVVSKPPEEPSESN